MVMYMMPSIRKKKNYCVIGKIKEIELTFKLNLLSHQLEMMCNKRN